jgi:hypothetical protein
MSRPHHRILKGNSRDSPPLHNKLKVLNPRRTHPIRAANLIPASFFADGLRTGRFRLSNLCKCS